MRLSCEINRLFDGTKVKTNYEISDKLVQSEKQEISLDELDKLKISWTNRVRHYRKSIGQIYSFRYKSFMKEKSLFAIEFSNYIYPKIIFRYLKSNFCVSTGKQRYELY